MIEIGWVVACISPWAVSPHPNFPEKGVAPYRVLALVAEHRFRDFEQREDVEMPEWAKSLLRYAKDSVFVEFQKSSAEELSKVSAQPSIPWGARVGAALLASVALSETEQVEVAIERLQALRKSLAKTAMADETRYSKSLAVAALDCQIAFRSLEIGDQARAAASSMSALTVLRAISKERPRENIEVSPGISWRGSQVQRDLRDALLAYALGSQARAEGFNGDTWVQIVKSRPAWPDIRVGALAASRDSAFVKQAFQDRIEAHRRRVTIGGSNVDSSVQAGGAALLVAELGGDSNSAFGLRADLGRLRLLKASADDVFESVEGIRLLRSSGQREPLESALHWTRSRGPNAVLVDVATQVIERPTLEKRLNEQDLVVLAETADLLEPALLARALRGVWAYLDRVGISRNSTSLERAWRAVARLLPDSGADQEAAARVLALLSSRVELLPSAESSIETVLREINLNDLSPSTLERLRLWASDPGEVTPNADLTRVVRELLDGEDGVVEPDAGVELAIQFVNDSSRLPPGSADRAIKVSLDQLGTLAEGAKAGRFAFGGVDHVELAVAVALETGSPPLWEAIVAFLLEPQIDRILKDAGVGRIAAHAQQVPKHVARALRKGWPELRDSPSERVFLGPTGGEFVAAWILASELGFVPRDEIVSSIARLSISANHDELVGAARLAASAVRRIGAGEWGQGVLLQLSAHHDPDVAASAALALAETIDVSTSITSVVEDRLITLLAADGIRRPLRILHGLQRRLAQGGNPVTTRILEAVQAVSMHHPSRIVRGAAENVLVSTPKAGDEASED